MLKNGLWEAAVHEEVLSLREAVTSMNVRLERLARRLAGSDLPEMPRCTGEAARAIVAAVARICEVPTASIFNHSRYADACRPRMIAMALAADLTELSDYRLSQFFNRNTGCIRHAVRTAANRCETEPKFKELFERCQTEAKKGLKP
jgi:chromosomal replication initiation ATPase DnaA